MVGHGGSSASSYLADPTSPIPSHCASIVTTSTLRVNFFSFFFQRGTIYEEGDDDEEYDAPVEEEPVCTYYSL